ncbi:hypothetical protein ANOM_004949 [Aspergillus nomiae NRRL 13137]|uniref:Transcription factor domain-containing protein n=1 Tax=Aspergillus nomiae NRRL (strain ATCC 15546 / NRRL 13137 / CBS 260.88 / M93) TaxID=1509407 RepID=A0A0L1J6H6_ASPN3|nr:uncharacterized protein ANOM_004949 [Aspergillus nomiae NRRL 13137]KNG87290.1 hypothetical protein ANOM_004949 [Aspergillus nomiae NRRL 13137]
MTPTTDTLPPARTSEYSPVGDNHSFVADLCGSSPEAVSAHRGDWGSSTKERILSTNLLDARDALDLIAVAGSTEVADAAGSRSVDSHQRPTGPSQRSATAHPVRETLAASWDRFFLVKRGIILAHEAVEYLDFYFAHLWHLLPIIPLWYSVPARYGTLADEEPVLTISLVTIASRYHVLSGFNGQARSERIHWRTWPWVQRLFQSSMWGSRAMRSLGSITALLLFIEWHPRAINSPEDLISDCADMEIFEPHSQLSDGEAALPGTETAESYRRPDPSSIPEKLNLVATAYRSNKMMLLSTAIALAKEIGCLGDDEVLTQTTSRGERESISVRKEWSFLLRTFIRLTDEALALRLRIEPHLASSGSVEIDRHASNITLDGFFESMVDLAPHMHKARELLHNWRRSQQGTGPVVPVAAWESFKRGLDSWERNRRLGQTDLSLRGACLDIEYFYIRLCGLSPAAHLFESSSTIYATNSYIMSLAPFAEEATKASVNMLEVVVQIFSSSEPFQYATVQCWLYVFCASLYLLKITFKMEQVDSHSMGLIVKVIDGIKENAPDDIHMSRRYAALLEILVNAALRTSESGSKGMDVSSQTSLDPDKFPPLAHYELGLGEDWIYDPNFWETLPDVVGLNVVPSLMPG